MKRKMIGVLISLLLILTSFLSVLSCKNEGDTNYYSLSLTQSTGGIISATLKNGSVVDGKYSHGSVIELSAAPHSGFIFSSMQVGSKTVYTSTYQLTITYSLTARAVFTRALQSENTMARIESAFLNTYDFSGYDEAVAVEVSVINTIQQNDDVPFIISSSINYKKDFSEIFLEISVEKEFVDDSYLYVCYYDDETEEDADFYAQLADQEVMHAKLPSTKPFLEAFLIDELPDTGGDDVGEYFSIELLEMLGVVYNVQNIETRSQLSIDIKVLADLIFELIEMELSQSESFDTAELPQIDFTLIVDYHKQNEVEKISAIGYIIDVAEGSIAAQPNDITFDAFSVSGQMELDFKFHNTPQDYSLKVTSSQPNSTISEIIDVIIDYFFNF